MRVSIGLKGIGESGFLQCETMFMTAPIDFINDLQYLCETDVEFSHMLHMQRTIKVRRCHSCGITGALLMHGAGGLRVIYDIWFGWGEEM